MGTIVADAIVIGAGIIGSSIAWRLAQRGLRVTLVDAGKVGGQASWAGAGMLAPGGEVTERTTWSDFAVESLHRYPEFVAELESESGHGIDYKGTGAIEVAATDEEWSALRARAEKQRALGIPSAAPADRERALFYPDDAQVDPRDVTRALLAACQARHVSVREGEAVTGIHARSGEVGVETAAGRMTHAGVAGASRAGAWSGGIPFSAALPLPGTFPVRGHLLGYQLAPGSLVPILRHNHTYILQRTNGFTIAGSSTETVGFDRTIDPDVVRGIARRAEALLPALREAGEPVTWLGFRPRADAHQPQIGRFCDSNLWLAYGHYRNGILLAPATAERVAKEIIASGGTGSPSPSGTR